VKVKYSKKYHLCHEPKILRIEKVKDFIILCFFNTGKKLEINFIDYFNTNPDNTIYKNLEVKEIFDTIDCNKRTVFWPKMAKQMAQNGELLEADYELDPVMLHNFVYKRAFHLI
jgi:hypothetical protein